MVRDEGVVAQYGADGARRAFTQCECQIRQKQFEATNNYRVRRRYKRTLYVHNSPDGALLMKAYNPHWCGVAVYKWCQKVSPAFLVDRMRNKLTLRREFCSLFLQASLSMGSLYQGERRTSWQELGDKKGQQIALALLVPMSGSFARRGSFIGLEVRTPEIGFPAN